MQETAIPKEQKITLVQAQDPAQVNRPAGKSTEVAIYGWILGFCAGGQGEDDSLAALELFVK